MRKLNLKLCLLVLFFACSKNQKTVSQANTFIKDPQPTNAESLTNFDSSQFIKATIDGNQLEYIYLYSSSTDANNDARGSIYDSSSCFFARFQSNSCDIGRKSLGFTLWNLNLQHLPQIAYGHFQYDNCCLSEYNTNIATDTVDYMNFGNAPFSFFISDTAGGIWKGTFSGSITSFNGLITKKVADGEFQIKAVRVKSIY